MQILKCKVDVSPDQNHRAVRVLRDHFNCEFVKAEKLIDGFDLEHEWWNSSTSFLSGKLDEVGAKLVILTPEEEIDTYEKRLAAAAEKWFSEQMIKIQ